MKFIKIFVICFIFLFSYLYSQEINSEIRVNGQKIPGKTHFMFSYSKGQNSPLEFFLKNYSGGNGNAFKIGIVVTPKTMENLPINSFFFAFPE